MMERSLKTGGPLSSDYTIQAHGLACERGGRLLFDDLSFALQPGDALLLSGANGSGKSSLLRLLAGFLPLTTGEIFVETALSEPMRRQDQMIYIGHANPLKSALSVEANIEFLRTLMNSCDQSGFMTEFGLSSIAATPARYLSSGQRRRTVLAAGLCYSRPIWLLDEPGVGLDRFYRQRLEAVIADHLSKGGVVIAASHGDVAFNDPLVLEFTANG